MNRSMDARPNRTWRSSVIRAALMIVVGCGTDGSQSSATLSVKSATSPDQIAGQAPPTGSTFEQISLTLHNDSSATPLSTLPTLFTLETDHALVLDVAAQQTELATPCIGNASVAAGGSLSCDVVFELPSGQTGTMLEYDDLMGHSASKAVPAATATNACIVVESYSNLYSSACTACQDSMCGPQGCAGSSCSAQCANMSPTAACACFETCDPADDCWSEIKSTDECMESHCADACK